MTIKKTLLSLILCTCVASANAGNLYSYDKYLTYHYGQGRITENAKAEDTIFAKYQAYNLFLQLLTQTKNCFQPCYTILRESYARDLWIYIFLIKAQH